MAELRPPVLAYSRALLSDFPPFPKSANTTKMARGSYQSGAIPYRGNAIPCPPREWFGWYQWQLLSGWVRLPPFWRCFALPPGNFPVFLYQHSFVAGEWSFDNNEGLANPFLQRSRTRSRSPSPRRRSYDDDRDRDRSRSPGRERSRRDRRDRSPANGHYESSRYSNYEDRAHNKEQMMQSVRESSQQDRRVYVGNLSYDVKWVNLKEFMRSGTPHFNKRKDYIT